MINVKFKSKKKVTFSPDNDTRVYNEFLIAKLSALNYSQNGRVIGKWGFEDENGVERDVTLINFAKSDVKIKEIEDQLGSMTVTYLEEAAMLRIKQIFPMILDQEKSNNPDANFGLGSNDVEHLPI
mgnify:CR=1 FL=1